MNSNKTIRRFSSREEQKAEVHRYWQPNRLASGLRQFGMQPRRPTRSRELPMILPEDLRQRLLAFNAVAVEYLVVGGYAVGIYAEPRATKDIDLFIR